MTVMEQEWGGKQETQRSPFAALLGIRNFRLLWVGEGISLLGDQFQMIALPWLVLKLTGDAFAIGTVLALAGIPRALFMLIGGALTDRFSPRQVMLVSNLVRMGLVLGLALLVLTGTVQLWMVYVFALAFGLADAFFYPAQSSINPRIVDKEHLQAANSITQGTAQITLFAGPMLAGALIAMMGRGQAGGDLQGIGLALAVDGFTFLISAFMLLAMRIDSENALHEQGESVARAIMSGLRYVWNDVALRTIFLLIAAVNFLINGPLGVGLPLLADTRLDGGAAAYGIVMSAFGAGSLLGIALAGVLPRPPARIMGLVLLSVWSLMGLATAALGLFTSTVLVAALMLTAGAINFYVVVIFMTWLQTRTPEAMLGRVISLMMFASIGLAPVSMALSGVLLDFNIAGVFGAVGVLMTLLVLVSMFSPEVRSMEVIPTEA
jgi:MFS family permease